jgi:hypothetical protein
LGDKDHELAQSLELALVADALLLVPPKPTGVVYQEHIEAVDCCVFQEFAELSALGNLAARHEFGVPAIPQYQIIDLGKALDVALLNIRTEAISLVRGTVPDVAFGSQSLEVFECKLPAPVPH